MLGLIVEGHGETLAAPILIRRVAYENELFSCPSMKVRRIPKSLLLKAGELERALEALSRQLDGDSPILVLIDADDDCPVNLAAVLKERCQGSHPHLKTSIVIANREYEAWFLAAAQSLAGHSGLPTPLEPPLVAESISGAKEWISQLMGPYRAYSETLDQASFSAKISLAEARSARSFRKFEREVVGLLTDMQLVV